MCDWDLFYKIYVCFDELKEVWTWLSYMCVIKQIKQQKQEQADGRQTQMTTVDVSACLEVHVVSCTEAKG